MVEQFRSTFPRFLYAISCIFGQLRKEEISPYYDGGSSLPCMAMHQDLVFPQWASCNDCVVHQLTNTYGLLVTWEAEILPVEVEILDAVVHEELRGVTKSCSRNDSITTKWMLTWLLKVEDGRNSLFFELLHYFIFFNKSIAEPLRPDEEITNPFTMQPFNGRISTLPPVFMFTPFAHTSEGAVQFCHPVKVSSLKLVA